MDFFFGPKQTEKTTLLLELANKFILENGIKSNNGFILLFTPPQINDTITDEDINTNLKQDYKKYAKVNKNKNKEYKFIQHLTRYMPTAKENMELIKGYELSSESYAFGLIDNFISISSKIKGLKLILIDGITNIINNWFNETIKKYMNSAKNEEKKNIEKSYLFIYNEIFKNFLYKIVCLQKSYQVQCFITIDIDKSDQYNFGKYSPKIFNIILPYVRNSFYLSVKDDQINFNESKLKINEINDTIEFVIKNELNETIEDENNIDYIIRKNYIEKKCKNINNEENYEKNNEWLKKGIDNFIKNINNFKFYLKQMEDQNKIEEESSYNLDI